MDFKEEMKFKRPNIFDGLFMIFTWLIFLGFGIFIWTALIHAF